MAVLPQALQEVEKQQNSIVTLVTSAHECSCECEWFSIGLSYTHLCASALMPASKYVCVCVCVRGDVINECALRATNI